MKVLLAPTEDFIKRDRTKVIADVNPGSGVTIAVSNSSGFLLNDFIVIGAEGSELAELCKITSISGPQAFVVATLSLAHRGDEPIVKYRYDKRKFYGSTTSGGAYTELTSYGSPAAIKVDDPQGTIIEYAGSEGYLYFKSTYFNSQTSDESNIADANEVFANESVRYCSLYAIRKQAGLTNNPFITDGYIETKRKQAENEVKSMIMARYTLPLTNNSGVAEVPAMIENVTILLAAGYLDYQEFGSDGEGVKWLGEARGILKAIGDGRQRLIGSDEREMQYLSTSNQVQSYPDQVDNTNGPKQFFTMDQTY